MILLHGPGEFAAKWVRVFPDLVATHRVIAPDLPAHGASGVPDDPSEAGVIAWLDALIENTCDSPPILVGHVLGGAIGMRYALARPGRLAHLVLVDTLGLAPFQPTPIFALTMTEFFTNPTEETYTRFMRQCSHDLDRLREELGDLWQPYAEYSISSPSGPAGMATGQLMQNVGVPPIPPDDQARITVPTTLIWGRHDQANDLQIAESASERYGWPLHVIENCADDPPRDEPRQFTEALRASLEDATPRA
jgi:pimeloyl-ACP methyl ester carboxylesterase